MCPLDVAIIKLQKYGIQSAPDKIHIGYLKVVCANFKTTVHYTEIYSVINAVLKKH